MGGDSARDRNNANDKEDTEKRQQEEEGRQVNICEAPCQATENSVFEKTRQNVKNRTELKLTTDTQRRTGSAAAQLATLTRHGDDDGANNGAVDD